MNNNYSLENIKEKRKNSYIVFKIANNRYAVEINKVNEVINMPGLEMPFSPPKGIAGIFDYNGKMIKVIDICTFLGFKLEKFTLNDKLIITADEDGYFAIHANEIENIISPDETELQDLPFSYEKSFILKIFKNESNTVNIIDIPLLKETIQNNSDKPGEINYPELFPVDEKSVEIFKMRAIHGKKNDERFLFNFNINTLNQFILFTLSNHNYYLDLKYVKEFIPAKKLKLTPLPYTDDFVKGIINLKGGFYVVIDLNCFINGNVSEIKDGSKVIITEGKNFNIALLVDEVKHINNLDKNRQIPSECAFSKYVYSEFEEDGILYGILNFDKILNDDRMYINII